MPAAARAEAARLAGDWRHVRARVGVWTVVRTLLQSNAPVSGRATIVVKDDRDHGRTAVVRTRAARPLAQSWAELPVFVMSATLPGREILETHFPRLVVAADVEAATPHAYIRQVTGAPTSGRKLAKASIDSLNVRRLHKHIVRRHIEVGRGSTLVVCQKEFQDKLNELGLPNGIAVGHFNAIAGLDGYRTVNHVMLVGRILPPVREVKSLAGALTGVEPTLAGVKANGEPWYDRVVRFLRMRDGTGRAVECAAHPDPTAEAVRAGLCEAELIQALGRARACNRTTTTPVTIDILADVTLPVTVDETLTWEEAMKQAGSWLEKAAEGVVLLGSPADRA
jgi:hypothetical protein